MWYGTATGTFTVVATVQFMPPLRPPCAYCKKPSTQSAAGVNLCAAQDCCDRHNRRIAIDHARDWMPGVFMSVPRDQRGRIYRALAAIFHPDAGGDEALMQALNAAKEQFG